MRGPGAAYEFGPFRLDPRKRVLWRDDRLLPVPPKAVEILLALVEQRGDVVGKDELMQRVWPDTFVEEANLSVQVAQLRKVLGDAQEYIETVPRRGYRFLARVRRSGLPTLAILPFRALDPRSQRDCLGIGMTDALVTRLAGMGSLAVRPTSAVLRYVADPVDPHTAAEALQVDWILDGKVQREGSRLRATVHLIPAHGNEPDWAEKFESEIRGLFDVQDAVAEQVAATLALKLGAEERRRLVHRPTQDLRAFNAYVKGRYFWSRFTRASLVKAAWHFRLAARHDPKFALPHAGLADTQLILGFSGLVAPQRAWTLAAASAQRALDRDPTVAEARVSLAYLSLFRDWDWEKAGQELSRAVDLSPTQPAPHQWYGLYLDLLGRFQEASREIETAADLDPLSLPVATLRALQAHLRDDRALELALARQAVELEPHQFVGHWSLGLACLRNALPDQALAEHRLAVRLGGGIPLLKPVLARTLALVGRSREARSTLRGLGRGSAYQRATVEVALGEREKALASLSLACQEREPWVVWLKVDPMLDPLRGDPRFAELVGRVFARAGVPAGRVPA